MQPTLEEIKSWARQAGDILRAGLGKEHDIRHKSEVDLVTEMDQRSEDYLVSQIRSRFPDHHILSEESGALDGTIQHRWYIDPLDGTTNYAHALPIFAVSIGYAFQGQMMLGVVYDPSRDECFSAERGRGAWLNEQPITVSQTAELIQALVVTGFAYNLSETARDNLALFNRFAHRAQGVRRLGSATLDLCYVACGRLDGYWEALLGPWDVAASALIAEEAGARITSLNGDAQYMKPPYDMVAANPVLHPQMLAVIQAQDAEGE
jgi:myo-inositol-1(or 4)-monophosphatase